MDIDPTSQCLTDLPLWIKGLSFFGVLFIERWLGRTPRLKAGSLIDLVVNIFKTAIKKLTLPKEQK